MPRASNALNQFISKFCEWAGLDDQGRRARLSAALRRAVIDDLPQRDGTAELEYRVLVNAEGLVCRYTSPIAKLYPNDKGALVVAVLSPDWRVGWRGISRDEFTRELVRDFFFFARQYIARSRMAVVVGGIAFTYGRACGFQFSADVTLSRANLGSEPTLWLPYRRSIEDAAAYVETGEWFRPGTSRKVPSGRKERELYAWIDATNALDPFVHRAVFQFWRSTALMSHQFWEESVTTLDGAVSVMAQFLKQRVGIAGNAREQLASAFGMSRRDKAILDHLYQLRCDFGAHPSRSKWWDFAEIYDERIEEMREAVKRAMWNLIGMEHRHRVVDPTPVAWSQWFIDNAPMVWDAVWFEHVR